MAAHANAVLNADRTLQTANLSLTRHEKNLLKLPTVREIDFAETDAPQAQYHTLGRSSNREAYLVQLKGQEHVGNDRCSRCIAGHGNFKGCISVPGACNSACGNCVYHSLYIQCSFHPSYKGPSPSSSSRPPQSSESRTQNPPARGKGKGKAKVITVSDDDDDEDFDGAEMAANLSQLPSK